MDYKQEYIKLKNKLLSNQIGSGHMGSKLSQELSNLIFVVDDTVLGDDTHAVILSLIKQFNKIAELNIPHNIEISQYYAVGRGLMSRQGTLICENCELVLTYIDNDICLTDPKYTKMNNIQCDVKRGSIGFFIKQKKDDTYIYTKINVVRLISGDKIESFSNPIYFDNEEINRINKSTNVAINRGQSDAILSSAKGGALESNNVYDISDATNNVEYIVNETKKASLSPQISKMNNTRVSSNVPSQSTVNAANTVATHISKTRSANNQNLSAILVPGKNAISLSDNSQPMYADMNDNETIIRDSNKFNSSNINNRAAINVDANLALLPTKDVISNKNIQIASPSQASSTSLYNKITQAFSSLFGNAENVANNVVTNTANTATGVATNVVDNTKSAIDTTIDQTKNIVNTASNDTGNIFSTISKKIGETTNKIGDFFTGNKSSSVVPVSKDLSVLTTLPPQTAGNSVPIPTNDINLSSKNMSSSQKTSIRKLNNMIANNHNEPVSINNSKTAQNISKNIKLDNGSVSRPNASISKSNASLSRPNASISRPNASISRPNASISRSNASISKPNASLSRPNASISRSNISISRFDEPSLNQLIENAKNRKN
ncbi:hypothetical protein LBA_00700 [Megavirus lba]|uniref:Uncharacterized protein n=1 Tax=Megavirus lba TaxID=1235314 RepID=L7Y6J4_9VIRU|nr:hypothetical protein LBA_00700 [Megavirus lba]